MSYLHACVYTYYQSCLKFHKKGKCTKKNEQKKEFTSMLWGKQKRKNSQWQRDDPREVRNESAISAGTLIVNLTTLRDV